MGVAGRGKGEASMSAEDWNKERSLTNGESIPPSTERSFDEFAKELADGSSSRRQALRWFGGALAGGLGGLLAIAGPAGQSAAAATVTTRIIIDGVVVKRTRESSFTYTDTLEPGCHTIRVVQRSSTGSSSNQRMRMCCNSEISVEIVVENTSVDMRAICG